MKKQVPKVKSEGGEDLYTLVKESCCHYFADGSKK